MTKAEIAADRALINAATPGPWRAWGDSFAAGVVTGYRDPAYKGGSDYKDMICGGGVYEGYFDGPDAEFIAASRTRWPAALDEIERLTARNKLLEKVAEAARRHVNMAHDEDTIVQLLKALGEDK